MGERSKPIEEYRLTHQACNSMNDFEMILVVEQTHSTQNHEFTIKMKMLQISFNCQSYKPRPPRRLLPLFKTHQVYLAKTKTVLIERSKAY